MNEMTMGEVLSRENLNAAYREVKANAGAPGVDGMSVEELKEPDPGWNPWAELSSSFERFRQRPMILQRPFARLEVFFKRPKLVTLLHIRRKFL
jgi:hypothetical protein